MRLYNSVHIHRKGDCHLNSTCSSKRNLVSTSKSFVCRKFNQRKQASILEQLKSGEYHQSLRQSNDHENIYIENHEKIIRYNSSPKIHFLNKMKTYLHPLNTILDYTGIEAGVVTYMSILKQLKSGQ